MSAAKKREFLQRLLLRRREVADILGFSQSQVLKFERQGLLHPIKVAANLRSVRYDAGEVEALAKRWIESSREPQTGSVDLQGG